MIKRFRTVLMMAIVIMLAIPCAAQDDGGGKKKKTVKTEQTQSTGSKRQRNVTTKQKQQSNAKVSEPDGYINEKGYVDLGLPSGIKWATWNVGATSPGNYGNYYAWGETKPKSSYNLNNYFDYLDSTGDIWGIYKQGNKTQITPTSGHDTARENWGGTWRMPTVSEFDELNDECTWNWSVRDGHNGYVITGPNGKSIFLPASGYRNGTSLYSMGEVGVYWSSSLDSQSQYVPYEGLHARGHSSDNYNARWLGYSVRPVTE